jgi:hypothetical protein
MKWGWVRIGIVSVAFLVGLVFVGPMGTSIGSKSSDILSDNPHIGGSLIVACLGGDLAVRHVGGEPGTVQLECTEEGKIVIIPVIVNAEAQVNGTCRGNRKIK